MPSLPHSLTPLTPSLPHVLAAVCHRCLSLNKLQAGVWFSLGCAAMRIDDFAASTRAFRRKVEIDDADFESWNNLANGYVKTGDRRRAYFAFHVRDAQTEGDRETRKQERRGETLGCDSLFETRDLIFTRAQTRGLWFSPFSFCFLVSLNTHGYAHVHNVDAGGNKARV